MMKTENKNAIQLLIWIFFIVIIFVMFKITNKTDKKEEKEENTPVFVNYKDMEINLLNNGYDYNTQLLVIHKKKYMKELCVMI